MKNLRIKCIGIIAKMFESDVDAYRARVIRIFVSLTRHQSLWVVLHLNITAI